MITGIEHVAICAKDSTLLKDWYKRIFGFLQVYENDEGTYFLKAQNGFMLEFIQETEPGEMAGEKQGGIRHIALMVDDMNEMIELLANEKITLLTDPDSLASLFFFRDPEGNILHLINRKQPL